MRFKDKVAVVTGAAQGIGEAYAKALAAEGAAVVVADLNADAGEQVAQQIEAEGGRAIFVSTDVSSHESAAAMVEAAVAAYGGIDLLVNNAAIYGDMAFDLLVSVDWDYYKKFMSVNMDGALVMTRAVYAEIAKRGEHFRAYIRGDESSLPANVRELAMILTAREMDCQFI